MEGKGGGTCLIALWRRFMPTPRNERQAPTTAPTRQDRIAEQRLVEERDRRGGRDAASAGDADGAYVGPVERQQRVVGHLGDGQLGHAEDRLELVGRRRLPAQLELGDVVLVAGGDADDAW